jgi:hypothetical protein
VGVGVLLTPVRILISRFLIRHVPTEAVVRRYDELFMVNHQVGFEMIFRADSALLHAGGSGDDAIKILQCHSYSKGGFMQTAKKLLATKRKVKLFDRQGKLWEEIEIPLGVLSGLPKFVAMADRMFVRHGEEYRECPAGDLYRAPLPYLARITG